MFEIIECKNLKRGEKYYLHISKKLGYIVTFIAITTHLVICKDVQLYDFERKKTYTNENDPYEDTCFFSKHEIYLRIISKEEYMNKLINVHANNMTNKILQTIINSDFIYY